MMYPKLYCAIYFKIESILRKKRRKKGIRTLISPAMPLDLVGYCLIVCGCEVSSFRFPKM
jgi:hypothetical protein